MPRLRRSSLARERYSEGLLMRAGAAVAILGALVIVWAFWRAGRAVATLVRWAFWPSRETLRAIARTKGRG